MNDRLQNAFKETPERFAYAVENALIEARQQSKRKKISVPFKIVIAVVLIFAVLPSTVFGAVKICGALAQKVGNFGLAIGISINEDAPKYVKMNIDVPKGFREQPNTGGLKFERDSEEWVFGFTILPMRFYENVHYTLLETDVKEYNEITISSRPSYELIGTENYHGSRRYFVWYEEANVLVLIYRGDTVTDSELEAFVDSISFTQGSESDHDSFFEPERAENEPDDFASYNYEYVFEEIQRDTEITFLGFNEDTGESELQVKSKITDIRITDNIKGLDDSDINSMYQSEKIADSNGVLLPKVVEVWQYGDGVNTETKMLSAESKEQKLILVDIEYTNTTDKEVSIYIPHRLETLTMDKYGNYNFAVEIDKFQDIAAKEYCDGEIFYMSSHGSNDKGFYVPKLLPNETRTITIGFRCIEEQLNNAYLVFDPITDGVLVPDYSDRANTRLIIKVQ